MASRIDPRGFLIATAVSLGLSVGAFPILYFNIGPTYVLHALIYFPLCIANGAFYVGITVKRRPDLSIPLLSFGGALTAILPACVLAVALSPSGMRVIDGREVLNPSVLVLAILFAPIGVFLSGIGAVVYAMWDEARFLRRNRHSDTPRALPRSRGRKI